MERRDGGIGGLTRSRVQRVSKCWSQCSPVRQFLEVVSECNAPGTGGAVYNIESFVIRQCRHGSTPVKKGNVNLLNRGDSLRVRDSGGQQPVVPVRPR